MATIKWIQEKAKMKKELLVAGTSATMAVFMLGCGVTNTDGGKGDFVVKGSASATAVAAMSPPSLDTAFTSGSPTSLKMTIYSAYISPNVDCTSPIKIADFGASGREFDLIYNPTIIDSTVQRGTYRCFILGLSDVIRFKANSTAAAAFPMVCGDTTRVYSFDIYRAGESDSDKWLDINGAPIIAHGTHGAPVSDKVFLFASTVVLSLQDIHQQAPLVAPLVVPGQTTFYFDARGQVSGGSLIDGCTVEGGVIGFR